MKKKVIFAAIALVVLAVSIPFLAIWGDRNDHRPEAYTGQWLEDAKVTAFYTEADRLVITQVYGNCFFGKSLLWNRTVKINGTLPGHLGVGDLVWVRFQNPRTRSSGKAEGDALYVGVLPQSWDMWIYYIQAVFR